MNAPSQTEAATDNTSGFPEVYYGRTSDGLFAALVGENAFAMIPAYNGEHYLGHAWKLPLPISEWKQSSFYGHDGKLDGKAAFRARVEENAEHQRQLRRLARRSIPARQATPWGLSDHATHYAEGIVCHSTPGHGGFHLDPDRNAHIHPHLRSVDGFYEEDCCWAAVAQAFPDLFTDFEKRCAEETIRRWYPDVWPGSLTCKAEEKLGGGSVEYAPFHLARLRAEHCLKQLNARDWSGLRDLSRPEDMAAFAGNIIDVWKVHPFREGNTRTTMIFMHQFAAAKGFALDRELIRANAEYVRHALVVGTHGETHLSLGS